MSKFLPVDDDKGGYAGKPWLKGPLSFSHQGPRKDGSYVVKDVRDTKLKAEGNSLAEAAGNLRDMIREIPYQEREG